MTTDATLLLDVGGQSCRALVMDRHGTILQESGQAVATCEEAGVVEQDADELAAALEKAALEVAGTNGVWIDRAALAVQRGSIVCWDRENTRALSPVLSWRDRRGLPALQKLDALADEIKQRSGLRFSPYGGASKLAWCLQELPEVAGAAESGRLAFGPLGSFLLARLLADHPCRVDDTLAQRTLLWSREDFNWDPWLLEQFQLPVEPLPAVGPSRDHYGHWSALPGAPPVELLIGDQNAIPFVDGQPDTDTLYINLGTGAFLLRPLPAPVDTQTFQLSLLDRRDGGRYALEASVHGAASAIGWLERQSGCHLPDEQSEGLRDRIKSPPLFVNSIDGLGSPWWSPGPEPGFVDEATDEPPALEARLLAVLESIAFLVRTNVDEMNRLVDRPERIIVCGGLSRAGTLCTLIADLLESDLLRLKSSEGTAMGLWCCLHQRALPGDAFETIPAGSCPGLMERYDKWLEQMIRSQR